MGRRATGVSESIDWTMLNPQHTHTRHIPFPLPNRPQSQQRALDAAYAGLSEEGLKALRRKLTLSKQRMEWSAALHRVSRLK